RGRRVGGERPIQRCAQRRGEVRDPQGRPRRAPARRAPGRRDGGPGGGGQDGGRPGEDVGGGLGAGGAGRSDRAGVRGRRGGRDEGSGEPGEADQLRSRGDPPHGRGTHVAVDQARLVEGTQGEGRADGEPVETGAG